MTYFTCTTEKNYHSPFNPNNGYRFVTVMNGSKVVVTFTSTLATLRSMLNPYLKNGNSALVTGMNNRTRVFRS